MNRLLIVAACLAVLLTAGTAQAYAIYNHVDHEICVASAASAFFAACKFTIPPHGKHNGSHGSGMKNQGMIWHSSGTCRCVAVFDIPDGGYARVYNEVVKVYKHNGKHVAEHDVYDCDCWGPGRGKKKP
ncbi:MAG: hypothetical protein KQH53_14420 [Desulfarculaceae bacterium]|nr:hypothetical protein [Desulfarculaceae bacterium]